MCVCVCVCVCVYVYRPRFVHFISNLLLRCFCFSHNRLVEIINWCFY